MQRHFSNRGEALPEATAARMLASGKRSAKPGLGPRTGRRAAPEQWFSRPAEIIPGLKRTHAKDLATLL
jgi:hypothetical protein